MTSCRLATSEDSRRPYVRPHRLREAALIAALLGIFLPPGPASAHVYQFDNVPGAPILIPTVTGGGAANTACDNGTSSLNIPFVVSDTFTATSIGVGLTASHTSRGHIRARLAAPDGTVYSLITQSGDTDDNYDILLSSNSDAGEPGTHVLDDNDIDPTAAPYYNHLVTVAGLGGLTEAANGVWALRLCDRTAGTDGNFIRARLMLIDGTAASTVCTSRVTYDWGTNGNGAVFTNATVGGVTIVEDTTSNFGAGLNSGTWWNFRTDTDALGGHTGYYSLYMDASSTGGGADDAEAIGQAAYFRFEVSGTQFSVHDLEFQTLDSDQADDDFEDIVRVEGTSPGGGFARFTRTPASGSPVFQDAGDSIEADAICSNASNCATETYRFDRPVQVIGAGYSGGDDVPAEPGDQLVGISDFQFCAFDFGDAPNSYGTTLASNGARHVMGLRNLYLGANLPDGESEGQATGGTLDDTTTVGGVDDEDGVATFPHLVLPAGTYTVSVNATNTSGAGAFLVGYIDWNADGDFNDTNERSATVNVANGSLTGGLAPEATNFNVTWIVPPSPTNAATYARFRISTSQAAAESPTGLAPDGEVEDYLIPAGTLPVTLAAVSTELRGSEIVMRWTTATETSNVGFRIWGRDAAGGRQLLARVPAQRPDSFGPRDYEVAVRANGVVALELEDVSAFGGKDRAFGPFAIGQSYGEPKVDPAVDWAAIKADGGLVTEVDRMAAAARGESLEVAPSRGPGPGRIALSGRILVQEEGIQRLTHEQLVAAGMNFGGQTANRISVTNAGAPVPIAVLPGGVMGPGAWIEFVARPEITLASPVDVYLIKLVPSGAAVAAPLVPSGGALATVRAVNEHENELTYSFAASNGDPWYEQSLLAWGAAASLNRSFDLPDLAAGPVELELRTWGIGGWPGVAPDHHLRVVLNGVEIADEIFDGNSPLKVTVDATALVQAAGNTIEVHVPGDTGYDFDYIAYDGFTVRYPRLSVAIGGRFAAEDVPAGATAIGGFGPGESVSVWRVAGSQHQNGRQTASGGEVYASGGADLYAAAEAGFHTPAVVRGYPLAQASSRADYVIVTHPVFADSLAPLVELQQAKGLRTEVVSVEKIYAAYSDHAASAEAIRSFFSASIQRGMDYALIVGADSSDPHDHLGVGSVSFVPTRYMQIGEVPFSPTDEALVDSNGDGLGDAAIGRFPARTPAELDAMIAKLLSWEATLAGDRTAVLASGLSDSETFAFTNLSQGFAAQLPGWVPVFASADELGSAGAKAVLIDEINAGAKIVSYVGHSSISRWDWTPVLYWSDVASLTNAGAPNLVTAWGCWNSYYVEPVYESLAAHLLRRENAGAAAAIGATTLTNEASHQELGNLFFQQVQSGATRVGDAFRAAKQQLAAQGGGADAILGMTLLGDPAMSLPRSGE